MLLELAQGDLKMAFKSDLIPYKTNYVQLLVNLIDSILNSFLSLRFLTIAKNKCHKVFAKLLLEGSSLLDLFICLTTSFIDVLVNSRMSILWRSFFTLHQEKLCKENSYVAIATEGSDQSRCNQFESIK